MHGTQATLMLKNQNGACGRWRRYVVKHNWIPERKLAGGWLCLLLVLLLTGCAATSILPRHYHEPAQVQSYKLGLVTAPGQTEDSLLVVQPDAGGASRWIQTN